MNAPDESFLHNCLFFTANRLSRAITKMAEDEFAPTGLTPMYGYLIRLAIMMPGITQKDLSEKLAVAPSTLTRFIDKLVIKGLVERKVQGKTVLVYATDKGRQMEDSLQQASKRLRERYAEVLGEEAAVSLTLETVQASRTLEKA